MRASVLSADAFSMSSVIRRVPSREDKTVAARGARDLLRAYDADPASVSLEQLEAVVSQVLRGGGVAVARKRRRNFRVAPARDAAD